MSQMKNEEDFDKWRRRRRHAMYLFIVESFLIGMEYQLTQLTLWKYLKDMVRPENPSLYYSIINASYILPSIALPIIIGRIIDRTRNVYKAFFIINLLVIIGNISYSIQYSPWFLVFGRFLSGCGGSLRSIINGEIGRIFSKGEVSAKLAFSGAAFSFGFLAGPAFNFMVKGIRFKILAWNVNFLNFTGLYMAAFFVIQTLLCLKFLTDVSKAYDLKADEEKEEISTMNVDEDFMLLNEGAEDIKPLKAFLTEIFTNFDTTSLLILVFFYNYFENTFALWLPLVVLDRLHWSINALGWIYLYVFAGFMFPLLALMVRSISDKMIFYIGLATQVALSINQMIYYILYYHHGNLTLNIVLFCVYGFMYALIGVYEEVFFASILGKMVRSKYQTVIDAIRLTFFRCGSLVAALLSPLVFKMMDVVSIVHIAICLIFFAYLLMRRHVLKEPKIVIY